LKVLYGMPLPPSNYSRLLALARKLPPLVINILIDHPDQLDFVAQAFSTDPDDTRIGAFIKVDTGYHRSGLSPDSPYLRTIVDEIVMEKCLVLVGFYSHLGHSYAGNSAEEAIRGLVHEIKTAKHAADLACKGLITQKTLTISVGATPTATAAQNLLLANDAVADEARKAIEEVGKTCNLELHAGVYPLLDLQQLATHARPHKIAGGLGVDEKAVVGLSVQNIGLRMLVEVASLYDDRGKPEALIAAGTLTLGREPCKSYPGWGIITSWEDKGLDGEASKPQKPFPLYDETSRTGWIVGRISQEHGLLVWEGDQKDKRALRVGQKVMVWPNHACVAGAGSGWYLIVDSDQEDPDRIVDVWVRWRGW
jgi:D-serine deaminase-like pyridoxal phosphate-dependent protein